MGTTCSRHRDALDSQCLILDYFETKNVSVVFGCPDSECPPSDEVCDGFDNDCDGERTSRCARSEDRTIADGWVDYLRMEPDAAG